jgi:1,2-diacylglycerol 3-alpha-glucosyltransferase
MPYFCDAVDLVISPSVGMEKILRRLGVKSPIEIVPNGVELQPFYHAEPMSRREFGLSPTDILLVYTGRLGPEKNLKFLIHSFAGVAQALTDVHLFIIGDGPERVVIEKMVGEIGLTNRIHFTGMIEYNRLPSYLSMCDAFVTASVTEVHPLSVIEAMGAGLSILGTHSPGVGDTVEDGVTGFLATEDLPAFTAKMTRLCIDHDLRRKMGTDARKASSRYAIEHTILVMLAHYEHLVYGSKPRKRNWAVRLRSLLERFRS